MTDDAVEALALKCFADMRSGQIDRSELSPEYSQGLSDAAVKELAKYMLDHDYGSPPKGAQILLRRPGDNQILYVVKLMFPRGDAASLLMGVDAKGKITGLNLMSMAGD